jgi:predicted XRE-type DNA-binding protein
MFVITADQVGSRDHADIAGPARDRLNRDYGEHLVLPADRTAGDEIQVLTDHAATVLSIILELTRSHEWSVGLGCGTIRHPLPSATREASGDAFFAARDAIDRAKKQHTRFAVETHRGVGVGASDGANVEDDRGTPWPAAADAEALINLLLGIRGARSAAGWEVYDLTSTGITQNEAASRLGITAPSVSSRAKAAGLKIERASIESLTRLLQNLDRTSTRMDPRA